MGHDLQQCDHGRWCDCKPDVLRAIERHGTFKYMIEPGKIHFELAFRTDYPPRRAQRRTCRQKIDPRPSGRMPSVFVRWVASPTHGSEHRNQFLEVVQIESNYKINIVRVPSYGIDKTRQCYRTDDYDVGLKVTCDCIYLN